MSAVPLPVTNGLRARYNATSWKSRTVWEDLSGNGNHMGNVSSGPSEYVSAENANMADNTTGSRFAYIRGDQDSRWDIGGYSGDDRMPVNSWTFIHIHRYDPDYSDKSGRVLGTEGDNGGDNVHFGTHNGFSGVSYHKGWVGFSHNKRVGSRYDTPWLFHIERPNKFSRTTTLDDNGWTDFSGGGRANVSFRHTISAGRYGEHAAWNIAELILFDRVLSDSEVEQFKTWMMDYKVGFPSPKSLNQWVNAIGDRRRQWIIMKNQKLNDNDGKKAAEALWDMHTLDERAQFESEGYRREQWFENKRFSRDFKELASTQGSFTLSPSMNSPSPRRTISTQGSFTLSPGRNIF